MAALWLEYGLGFAVNSNGGLAMAQGWDETRQTLERIALTAAQGAAPNGVQVDPECQWDPTFGLSMRTKIGQLLPGQALTEIKSAVTAAAATAPGTNPSKPPTVTASQIGNTVTILCIIYLSNGLSGNLSYQVS